MTSNKKNMTEKVEFRCTKKEKKRIEWLAKIYGKGNVSDYSRKAVLNTPRIKRGLLS